MDGKTLKIIREVLNKTIGSVANDMGVTKQHIYNIEHEKTGYAAMNYYYLYIKDYLRTHKYEIDEPSIKVVNILMGEEL